MEAVHNIIAVISLAAALLFAVAVTAASIFFGGLLWVLTYGFTAKPKAW